MDNPDQIPDSIHLVSVDSNQASVQITPMDPQGNLTGTFIGIPELTPNFQSSLSNPVQKISVQREKDRISQRLGNFNPKDNEVWRFLTLRFGQNIKQQELLSIADVLSKNAGIKLDRDAKRRKSVLIKWFEENWQQIKPYINYVVLDDGENGNVIL